MASPIVQSSALVVTNAAGTSAVTLTGVAAGNALVVTASLYDATANITFSVKDGSTSFSNQYKADTPGGNYSQALIAWELAVTAGSHTITLAPSNGSTSSYYAWQVHEVAAASIGSATPTVTTSGTTTGATLTLAGGTPPQSGDLIFTAIADDGYGSVSTATATTPSGYTSLWSNMAGSSSQVGAAAYQVQTTAAPVAPSWTGLNAGGGAGWAAVAVAFAPASGSGISANAATTDGADTQAAQATPVLQASAATTDGADTQAAQATPVLQASAATTDGADTQAAQGTITSGVSASAATTDSMDAQVAQATPILQASAATTDGADTQAAQATPVLQASAATTDGADTQAAQATPVLQASAATTDGADTQTAQATPVLQAYAATTDGADTQVAQGAVLSPLSASAATTDGADGQTNSGLIYYIDNNLAARFAAIQAAVPSYYVNTKPNIRQSAIFTQSGTWTVPANAKTVLVSATAAGGYANGSAGQQIIKKQIYTSPGDTLNVNVLLDVNVALNGVPVLNLLRGQPYGNVQSDSYGADSGILGFGSGVQTGAPDPAIAVILWDTQ